MCVSLYIATSIYRLFVCDLVLFVFIFTQRKTVNQMNFDFKGKERAYGYARSIASSLQKYPIENVLQCMGGVKFDFDVKKTRSYLNELKVDNAYYLLICKDFEDECKETEKWYNTKFNASNIDDKVLNDWKGFLDGKNKVENDNTLHTPPLNPYIADNFDIFCEKLSDLLVYIFEVIFFWLQYSRLLIFFCCVIDRADEKENNPPLPTVVCNDPGHRLWFRMDDDFKKPKLYYNFRIRNEILGATPKANILSELVMSYLNDSLSKQTYAFSEASLNFYAGYGGRETLLFSFGGYNQKLPLLVDTVLNKFTNLEFDPSRFEDVLESVRRQVMSSLKAKPYQHCDVLVDYMLLHNSFTIQQLVEAVESVTLDEVKAHYLKFLDNCEIYIEGLLYGNVDKQGAKQYSDLVQKYLLNKNKYKNQKYMTMKDIVQRKNGALKLPQDGSTSHVLQC